MMTGDVLALPEIDPAELRDDVDDPALASPPALLPTPAAELLVADPVAATPLMAAEGAVEPLVAPVPTPL
jgi:hypothetical protein